MPEDGRKYEHDAEVVRYEVCARLTMSPGRSAKSFFTVVGQL